jgi:hypothetical protein
MELERNQDTVVRRTPDVVVPPPEAEVVRPVRTAPAVVHEPLVEERIVAAPAPVVVQEAPTRVVTAPTHIASTTSSYSRFAAYAVAGALVSIFMMIWGGVAMARAGFDAPLDDPAVTVGPFQGNALSGAIVFGLGLVFLIASLVADRNGVMFFGLAIGIASVIAAIEPNLGNGALDIERSLPLLLAIACGVVVLLALTVPTLNQRRHVVEQV